MLGKGRCRQCIEQPQRERYHYYSHRRYDSADGDGVQHAFNFYLADRIDHDFHCNGQCWCDGIPPDRDVSEAGCRSRWLERHKTCELYLCIGGAKTLYAWAKDAAGNVSNSLSAGVTITISDTVQLLLWEFSTKGSGVWIGMAMMHGMVPRPMPSISSASPETCR